jgi:hypothetical protein
MKLAYVSLEAMEVKQEIVGRTDHLLSFDITQTA